MENIIIRGGESLSGEIPISGAKNSALPLMAATLLTKENIINRWRTYQIQIRFMYITVKSISDAWVHVNCVILLFFLTILLSEIIN